MKRLSKEHRRTRATSTGTSRRPEVVASAPLPVVIRITISFLGVLIVCCAATAICTIVAKPPPQPSEPPPPAEPINGALALRPDLVRETVWPFNTSDGHPSQPGIEPRQPPLPQAKPPATHGQLITPHAGSMEATAEVVTALYSRLAEDPARALDLLAPQLHAGDREALIRAWQDVSAARSLLVDPRPGGVVVSEIGVDYPDGERVVLRHRVTVDWHLHPHIVTVDLLTARKFHAR